MSDTSQNNRRIAKNSIFLSIRMIIVLGITLFTTRAVLNVLGVEDYGVYNVVCGFVSMFTFLNTSMSNGVQRFFNFELGKNGEEGAKIVYNTSLVIQFALAIIIIVFAETLGLWYLNKKMVIPNDRMIAAEWIFQFSILSFFFIILQAPYTAAVMAHEKMDFFSVVSVLDAVIKLAIAFAVPYFGADNLIVYGILLSLVSLFNFSVYYVYCKRHFPELRLKKSFDKKMFQSMLGFSGWNIFGALSGMMKEQGINMVMNLFFGPVVNAARGVAVQVSSGFQSFVQNLTIPVRPQVIQSYAQGNISRMMSLTFSISKMSCFVLYIVSLPILVEINFVLNLWLGANVPVHTASFIYIIVFTAFISNLNSAISGVVHASGKMMVYQIAGGLAGILSVPVAYAVLYFGGSPESALWTSFVAMSIAQVNALIILKTIVNYSILSYLKEVMLPIVKVVLTTFFVPFIVKHYMAEGYLRFGIILMVSVIATCLSVYLCGLNKSEKSLIQQFIIKFKQKIF